MSHYYLCQKPGPILQIVPVQLKNLQTLLKITPLPNGKQTHVDRRLLKGINGWQHCFQHKYIAVDNLHILPISRFLLPHFLHFANPRYGPQRPKREVAIFSRVLVHPTGKHFFPPASSDRISTRFHRSHRISEDC